MRFILLLLLTLTLSNAKSRIALLIGNSNYPNKHLINPINDINLLEKKLNQLHFDVTKKSNLNRVEMIKALRNFYSQISSDTIALIYFSGHGVHSTTDNKNYLIPIGAFESLLNEADLGNEAISDGKLLASTSGAKFSILLLDACRSNDFAKVKGDKGLGQPQSRLNNDYVISYATEVGKTAKDGDGNSPYAKALAEFLTQPYSIGDIFTKVRAKVSRSTMGQQKPYYAPHFENILYLSNKVLVDSALILQSASIWMTPTKKALNWVKAQEICRDNNRRLPTIKEFKKVITDCGGGNNFDSNIKNTSYQSCYQRKGFSSKDYWSSNIDESDPLFARGIDFYYGGNSFGYKTNKHHVRCFIGE